jgi:Flp pilus assembly protein TadG
MRHRGNPHARNGERGVTMIIVVIAMMSMLAMVALAVDVITLYAARSEAQRAADAAALAAAKMLVDAGVTGDPTLINPTVQSTAQTLATQAAQSVAGQSGIAGRPIAAADVAVTFPNGGNAASFAINPTVNVTVQNTNLPTFFARIWSRAALTVRATATAEGFNPSNSQALNGGTGVPVIARGVKPFLLPNCDPVNVNNPVSNCVGGVPRFFDATTGALINPGPAPTGIIGETFNVSSACGPGPACAPGGATAGLYYPIQMPPATDACPSTCGGGGTNFETDIECSNPSPISCGAAAVAPIWNALPLDTSVFPEGGGGPAQTGVECLIHQRPGNGMDTLTTPITYPLQIQVGNNHPLEGTPTLSANDYITTSDSLVTVPVYEPLAPPGSVPPAQPVIVGFLQVFINRAHPAGGGPKAGSFDVTIVNVAGCGSGATAAPVYTGNSSAVPVRLIHR